jgi:hypothetical protein
MEEYVRCVIQSQSGSEYLDLALQNAQAVRNLEMASKNNQPPRLVALKLMMYVCWCTAVLAVPNVHVFLLLIYYHSLCIGVFPRTGLSIPPPPREQSEPGRKITGN